MLNYINYLKSGITQLYQDKVYDQENQNQQSSHRLFHVNISDSQDCHYSNQGNYKSQSGCLQVCLAAFLIAPVAAEHTYLAALASAVLHPIVHSVNCDDYRIRYLSPLSLITARLYSAGYPGRITRSGSPPGVFM